MNDFLVRANTEEDFEGQYLLLEFESIPRFLVQFIVSRKKIIIGSYDDFEIMKFYYSDEKRNILKLKIDIKNYKLELDSKNVNELIVKSYLEELESFIENFGLVKQKVKRR